MIRKPPFIIDAGPALNFLASGHERVLTNAIGRQALHAPASVEGEVLRKCKTIKKFKGAAGRWNRMKPTWLKVLSDDAQDPALLSAAHLLLNAPLAVRLQEGDDLGETMVTLHAYVKAMSGEHVFMIMDDRNGRKFAQKAIGVVARHQQAGRPVGRLQLVSTIDIIERRINTPDIPDMTALQNLWAAISPMDDGLPNNLNDTRLPTSHRWHAPARS